MKKILYICLLIIFAGKADAQILKPVKWSYAAKRIDSKTAIIYFKASIEKEWHIYSQYGEDGGPVKTSFSFSATKDYEKVGKTIEPKPVTIFERNFEMNVSYFENSVIFQQKILLKKGGPVTVKGVLEYMTCNDEKCLPPEEVPFSVMVK